MSTRMLWVLSMLCVVGPIGCGGGGGAPGKSAVSKSQAKACMVATARIEQAVYAVIGLGRPITRTVRPRLGLLGLVPLSRRATRDTVQGQDPGTQLYYTRTIAADGSGQLSLFLDAADSMPAGNMTWPQPNWSGNQINSYPATIHMTFQLTAGKFAGNQGTLDNTTQDVTGNNEALHLALTDAEHETVTTDFTVVNGVLNGKVKCHLGNGTDFSEDDAIGLDGVLHCHASFPDGSQEILTTGPTGVSTETYYESDGVTECTGNYDDSGMDTINYSDGSSETVNVDDSGSSGDGSDGGDSGDSGSSSDGGDW
jgi:hypothetical protein